MTSVREDERRSALAITTVSVITLFSLVYLSSLFNQVRRMEFDSMPRRQDFCLTGLPLLYVLG
jgi:hypothetical protein